MDGVDGDDRPAGSSVSASCADEEPAPAPVFKKAKTRQRSPDSASTSSSATAPGGGQRLLRKGWRLRGRHRNVGFSGCAGAGKGSSNSDARLSDLAVPLGISIGAFVATVLDRENITGQRISSDYLSLVCTTAVKESLTYMHGDQFDGFVRSFQESFGSTLRSFRVIKERPLHIRNDSSLSSSVDGRTVTRSLAGVEFEASADEIQHNVALSSTESRLVLHAQASQQLVNISSGTRVPEFDLQLLSLQEQARSNILKQVEIGVQMKKLELKQSQLALSAQSHDLEKIKLNMGVAKASFKEEKLRNEMQDMRLIELSKRLIDFLVTGVIVMCFCLSYSIYIYSFQRITEVTSVCASLSKESHGWWMPKSVSNFNSGWHFFRCHLAAFTRMFFGALMILAITWLILQRSAKAAASLPITFNVVLMGAMCGIAGKLCIDTFGGDGYCWLVYWECICLLHFVGNVFPSVVYRVLHGPISIAHQVKAIWLPYWIRRYMLYAALLFLLPMSAGLLPFASVQDWKEHFSEKITIAFMASEVDG